MTRIVKRAGLQPWPRLFHARRVSAETDPAAEHPIGAVCRWIGDTTRIAPKHYLQPRDADFARAATEPWRSAQGEPSNGDTNFAPTEMEPSPSDAEAGELATQNPTQQPAEMGGILRKLPNQAIPQCVTLQQVATQFVIRTHQRWTGPGSNRRHQDFQSCALPTELPVRPEVRAPTASPKAKIESYRPLLSIVKRRNNLSFRSTPASRAVAAVQNRFPQPRSGEKKGNLQSTPGLGHRSAWFGAIRKLPVIRCWCTFETTL